MGTSRLRTAALPMLLSTVLLAACGGGGGGDDHDHEHTHLDSVGRLALIEAGSPVLRVFDLDDRATVGSITLANPPSAVVASPGHRYALVLQRDSGLVQFVDGGLWQEDHVDHLHDYKQAPRLLDFRLAASRPTHYETHDGLAALFFDGDADDGQPASVSLLTDASVAAARAEAQLSLDRAMHGTAEPRGEFLLVSDTDPQAAAGSLPDGVALYRRGSAGLTRLGRFDTGCPGLHGSFSSGDYSVFGCLDGVLVVAQAGENFSARKLANPAQMPAGARIGTLVGHEDLDRFVGIASPGLLFEVDPAAGTITPIDWAADRTRRAHGFDAHGERFLVLDDEGVLHVLDPADGWHRHAAIPVIDEMPAAAPFPSIAVSRAAEQAFVSDPMARAVAVIDLEAGEIEQWIALDFAPTGLAWLGIEAHEHGEHGHEH